MTNGSFFAVIWIAAGIGYLLLAEWLQLNGYSSDSVVELWSTAILLVEGPEDYEISRTLSTPLPEFFAVLWQFLAGTQGIAAPTMVSAFILGLLCACWVVTLMQNGGYSMPHSILLVVLLTSNPLVMFAVSENPELPFLFFGVWIYGQALITSRLKNSTTEMMRIAISLLIMGFSSSYGLLTICGAFPFLVAAAPPNRLISAPSGYLAALGYPIAFVIGTQEFLSWVYNLQPVPHDLELSHRFDLVDTLSSFLTMSIPTWCVVLLMRKQVALIIPHLSSLSTIAGAMYLNLIFGPHCGLLASLSPLVSISAVSLQFWPRVGGRLPSTISVLILCWVLAAMLVTQSGDKATQNWWDALRGKLEIHDYDAVIVAKFLENETDILLDAEMNPSLIVALKSLSGLVLAGAVDYQLTLLGETPVQTFLVVRNTAQRSIVNDRILLRFPEMLFHSLEGYSIAIQVGDWTVWKRNDHATTED